MSKIGIECGAMQHNFHVSSLKKRENYFVKYRSDGDSNTFLNRSYRICFHPRRPCFT